MLNVQLHNVLTCKYQQSVVYLHTTKNKKYMQIKVHLKLQVRAVFTTTDLKGRTDVSYVYNNFSTPEHASSWLTAQSKLADFSHAEYIGADINIQHISKPNQ